jgi:hypothetical protein
MGQYSFVHTSKSWTTFNNYIIFSSQTLKLDESSLIEKELNNTMILLKVMHDMFSCCLMKVTFFVAQKGGAFCAFLTWCCLLCCIHCILFTFNVLLLFESVFKFSKLLRHWNLVNLVSTLKIFAKLVKQGAKTLVRIKIERDAKKCKKYTFM